MLFASPDFGAGGTIVFVLFVICLFITAGVIVGLVKAVKLLRRNSAVSRLSGVVLLLACVTVPLSCWFAPGHLFRTRHGNDPLGHYPIGVVKEGMTRDEVRGLLGNPHQVHSLHGEESWSYYLDPFGIDWFGVSFGPDGRVISTGGS